MRKFKFLLAVSSVFFVFSFYGCKQESKEVGKEVEKVERGIEKEPKKEAKRVEITGKVNINTATVEELSKLPGIKEKLAKRIVAYRAQHGNFKTIEDIKNVKANWDKRFDKIKDHITVGEVMEQTPTTETTPAPEGGEDASTSTPEAD